jgi:hypothetical protein
LDKNNEIKVGVIKMVVRVLPSPPVGAAALESESVSEARGQAEGDGGAVARGGGGSGGGGGSTFDEVAARERAAQARREARVEAWWAELETGPRQLKFVARVYALEGRGMNAKDDDGKSDPYIRAQV